MKRLLISVLVVMALAASLTTFAQSREGYPQSEWDCAKAILSRH